MPANHSTFTKHVVAILVLFLPGAARAVGPDRVVLGYSPVWFDSVCSPECINYDALTHLARAFIIPKPDGNLDVPAGYFNPTIEKLARGHHVKLLISIGGEAQNADHWLSIARNPQNLNRFMDNLAALINEHHYDGIDIDWEPSALNDEDGAAYVSLLKHLRAGMPNIVITTALGGSEYWVSHFSWPDVLANVNFVNVMVYTYSGAWGGRAAYASNLFPPGAYAPEAGYSADEGMRNLIEHHHAPPDKLLMGVTFWASRFAVDHVGDTFPKNASGYSCNITYSQTVSLLHIAGYRDFWDDKAQMPYLERPGGGSVVCYEDEKSIRAKCEYAKKLGCAGVMIWHVGADLSGDAAPLMDALAASCGAKSSPIPPAAIAAQIRDVQRQIEKLPAKAAENVTIPADLDKLDATRLQPILRDTARRWTQTQDAAWQLESQQRKSP